MKSKSPLRKIRALKGMRSRNDGSSSSAPADVMHLDTIVTRCDPKAIDGVYRHAPAALHVPRQIDACPGISFAKGILNTSDYGDGSVFDDFEQGGTGATL